MNEENKTSKATLVRTILSAVAMIIVILGIAEIVPNNIALIIAVLLVCAVAVWNGIDSIKNSRKKTAIMNFTMAGILIILSLAAVIL